MKTQLPSRNGSVLILALWALFLLSAALFAWLKFISVNVAITSDRNNGLEAKALAHSGVMVALNPQVSRVTPLLSQWLTTDRGYEAKISGEAGRLNLNWLFTPPANPDPVKLAMFQRYLEQRGLTLEQRNHFVDSIIDWLNPSHVGRLNGAEDSEDYHPPHRGVFLDVDELAQVAGSQPLVSQAGWEDDFTIFSTGPIDLQSAPERVIECLPNVGSANAVRFLRLRAGPDGVDGTTDDYLFHDIGEALSYLGQYGQQAGLLGNYVELENPLTTVHIMSIGQCGNVKRRVEVVAKKQGMQPNIMFWKEE